MFRCSFGVDGLWRIEKLPYFYGPFCLVMACAYERRRKNMGLVKERRRHLGLNIFLKINPCGMSSWMVTCTWAMSSALVGSWLGPYLRDFSKCVIQLGELSKCRRAFLEGSQHCYYSVWKDIYFPQNPLTFKSKKTKFLKDNILPLGVWLHKFPNIFFRNFAFLLNSVY